MPKWIALIALAAFAVCVPMQMISSEVGAASSVGIIGGADGPTRIFLSEPSEEEMIPTLLNRCAEQLNILSGDETYIRLLTTNEEICQIIERFHRDSESGLASWDRISDIDALFESLVGDTKGLSGESQENLRQRLFSASYLASTMAAQQGSVALAATSLLTICQPIAADIPSSLYVARCENDTGIVMGIWNDGCGLNLVTASFVPNIGILPEMIP